MNRSVQNDIVAIMGRYKTFDREELLQKAMLVFWEQGFSHTSLSDLEKATGVNRSGLYSEFKGKDDIFLECLKHYVDQCGVINTLNREPLGWDNIEAALLISQNNPLRKGCMGTNSMREMPILPKAVQRFFKSHVTHLRELLIKNLKAAKPKYNIDICLDIVFTFNSGLALHQNMKDAPSSTKQVKQLLKMMGRE